ncbi:MAG: hypothetical protein GY851_15560 [bacterium]|nr:hypothetical protein [bacterium]
MMMGAAILIAVVLQGANTTPASPAPQPEANLAPVLHIDWTRGPNLPQGFQDSDGGIVGGTLITLCGFCSGQESDVKPGRYPRGFFDMAWGLDLANRDAGWRALPAFPGAPRQENFAIVVDDALYCWGGFSYSQPYCYADGWRLTKTEGAWRYDTLPDLPTPLCSSGIAAIGARIYVMGGADYNAQGFFTAADRNGEHQGLGSRLYVIDTHAIEAGWQRLPDCPGTPRWIPATAAVGGKLYVVGGATGSPYTTVVDNWVYDPALGMWSRIRDLPIASGNFPSGAIAYEDRYVLLIGGYQYDAVTNPDGTTRAPYGTPQRANGEGAYFNDVSVYDTERDLFGRADSLPINNNLPMAVVRGDEVFLIGGETGGGVVEGEWYGHHPDLLLIGKITEAPRTE